MKKMKEVIGEYKFPFAKSRGGNRAVVIQNNSKCWSGEDCEHTITYLPDDDTLIIKNITDGVEESVNVWDVDKFLINIELIKRMR